MLLRPPTRPRTRWVLGGLALAGVLAGVLSHEAAPPAQARHRLVRLRTVGLGPPPGPAATTMEDPLFPGHPVRLLGDLDSAFTGLRARPGSVPRGLLPAPADRMEKSAAERGGVDPCQTPEGGFGIYHRWYHGTGVGKILVPHADLPDPDRFDLLVHFAGHELARKELTRARVPFVFLAASFGASGLSYREHIGGPKGLLTLLWGVTDGVRKVRGRRQQVRNIALAAWSAGYDGVAVLLQQSQRMEEVDAVILLDGLHTAREPELADVQLEAFVRFAERAARGDALMFVSYSSVGTDGFASTHESARRLIHALGGDPVPAERLDPGGLELKELYSQGGFHARGYRGSGALDHCAHLLLYPWLSEALGRRWGLR